MQGRMSDERRHGPSQGRGFVPGPPGERRALAKSLVWTRGRRGTLGLPADALLELGDAEPPWSPARRDLTRDRPPSRTSSFRTPDARHAPGTPAPRRAAGRL